MTLTRELRYRLEQDTDASDPRREWDHFSTMVCDHRSYELGDRKAEYQEREAYARGGLPLLERYLRRYFGAVYVAKLGLLDHSGLHIYLDGGPHWSDGAGWDSGTVGFIYVTHEQLDLAGIPPDMTAEKQARIIAEQEVQEYDAFVGGDVYGYIIDAIPECDTKACEDRGYYNEPGYGYGTPCECACHRAGDEVNSCWGFYGHQYAEQEAKVSLEAIR